MDRNKQKPTGAQLEILQILWRDGPSVVNQVWEKLGKKTGYTGILKLMQVMHKKGFLKRDESQRSHVYSADHIREVASKNLLSELKQKAFGGSAAKLVLSALSDEPVSSEELQQISELIRKIELERKKK